MPKNGCSGTFSLKKFNLETMDDTGTCILAAKRCSGKSVLIRDICRHKKDFPCGVVICPTDESTGSYREFFPDLFVHFDLDMEIIRRVFARQKAMKCKRDIKKKEGKAIDNRFMIIMDDCAGDPKAWAKDKSAVTIMTNGRHYKIFYILAIQDTATVDPKWRSNFDYIFIFNVTGQAEQRRYYERFAAGLDNFSQFQVLIEQVTQNHGILVFVKRGTKSSKLEDIVFHYRVNYEETYKPFSLGSRKCREYHKKYYNQKFYEEDWQRHVKEIMGKTDKPKDINGGVVLLD